MSATRRANEVSIKTNTFRFNLQNLPPTPKNAPDIITIQLQHYNCNQMASQATNWHWRGDETHHPSSELNQFTPVGDRSLPGSSAFGAFHLSTMVLNDPPTIAYPDASRYMTRESPSPEILMTHASSPRYNSPVNLPMNCEFPAAHAHRRRVLVDVTLLTSNARKHDRQDSPIHSNISTCSDFPEPFIDDCSERPAKRHCRSSSTSTIGSTLSEFVMDESTMMTDYSSPKAVTPEFMFHPISQSENASFPCK